MTAQPTGQDLRCWTTFFFIVTINVGGYFYAVLEESLMQITQIELDYIYFEADEGGYVGYFKDFPQHVTQGETIEELEDMLLDLYECLNLSNQ